MWKVIVTDHFCYVNGTSIIFSVKQRAKKMNVFHECLFLVFIKGQEIPKGNFGLFNFQKKNPENVFQISARSGRTEKKLTTRLGQILEKYFFLF